MTTPTPPIEPPVTPPAVTPPAAAPTPPARPEAIPEAYWDATAGAIKMDDFGKHYAELATFHQTETERRKAIPEKPEDYKLALPEDFKIPDGVALKPDDIKFDEKDPRVPALRQLAKEVGLDQAAVSKLLALDVQAKIAEHVQAVAYEAEQTKLLGDKAGERKSAVGNWLKGMHDRKELSDAEFKSVIGSVTDAAHVTAFEKIIAKMSGSVPGNIATPPPPAQPKGLGERIWGDQAFKPNPAQARVG